MKTRMIFYDLESDLIRTRLAKKLLALGFIRIQYSVFCGCHTDSQWEYCKTEIDIILDVDFNEGDKVHILQIKPILLKQMKFYGEALDLDQIYMNKPVYWI